MQWPKESLKWNLLFLMEWLTAKRENKITYLFIGLRKLHAIFDGMADKLPIPKLCYSCGPDWLTPGPQKSSLLVFWTHTTLFIFIWVLQQLIFIKNFYMLGPFIFTKVSTFQLFHRPFLICHIKVYIQNWTSSNTAILNINREK